MTNVKFSNDIGRRYQKINYQQHYKKLSNQRFKKLSKNILIAMLGHYS